MPQSDQAGFSATAQRDHILEVQGLEYTPQEGRSIFCNLSFRIPRGAFVLLRGSSGAGKSTLLRLLARLTPPTKGRLLFAGKDYIDYPPPELRSRVSYLQQSPTVLDDSVRHNLLLPFGFRQNRQRSAPDDAALRAALDEFLLQGVALTDNASLLSVGQKQRLCFARSLLLKPEVLLLDEPTSALDLESRKVVEARTDAAHQQGVTIVLVSHNEQETHERRAPHVLELSATPRIPETLQ